MKRGFTLVEVVVALTIAGIIALAARAAVTGGFDTEERVQVHAALTERDARFRALLVTAIRHMTDAPTAGVTPFTLRDTVLAETGPSHVVEFYSRGLSFPAGSGATLRVQLVPADEGLTIQALDEHGFPRVSGIASGVAGMRMRVRTLAGEWLDGWPRTLQLPAAISMDFTPRTGVATPAPLIVTVGLESSL